MNAADLLPHLTTRDLGREGFYHPSIASTQTAACALAAQGAAHGTLVWADRQTQGRGRMGRPWLSAQAGEGSLAFSVILSRGVVASAAPEWSFVAGLAVAAALEAQGVATVGAHGVATVGAHGNAVTLKWPNDIYVARQKVGGILTSLETPPGGPAVVVGIGLNLAFDAAMADPALAARAGTLSAYRLEPAHCTAAILAALEQGADAYCIEGAAGLLAACRARLALVGEKVQVHAQSAMIAGQGGIIEGIVRGLADDFSLELEDAAGARVRVSVGDVWPVEGGV